MSFLVINNVQIPPPKRGVDITISTIVNSGRNENATVVGQKIGRDQYKIDGLEWPHLYPAQWASILQSMADFFFNVTFIDPVTLQKRTIKMYCGDRHAEPYRIDENGVTTEYINCKVNLIDTGE